ncbi:pyridoxal phosphate-dependent aminotransferase [Paracoccus sp. (in: a-proteobacteria)]|uniref:pyridoxal phosphate-dependent aminotransferase n=1 Tax=Paracoccus sp. TaxID=267 RepID=UPI00289A0332|nr:pyridoxal phosphate-dependent aminotransferase [Paracoccus sp. (in: a-proteobacteria)]
MRYASMTDRLASLGSDKWELHARGRALAQEGKPVIELTIGEPDIAPDSQLLDICNQAMRAGRTRYSNGRGEPSVLEALAAKYSARSGRAITADNILCLPGTQTALFAVFMALVEAGDQVLVPDPYYATYESVIRAPGAEVVPVALRKENGFHLTPADLEAAITPQCRALLLNSPHNPSGAVLSREEIRAIGQICIKHDLWLVSDEVYEHLIFDAEFASPLDLPELAERTIVVSSISKSHAAPGFRSGWAIGPQEFCARMLPISESMLFGGQPFIADMTAHALASDLPTSAIMREQYGRRAKMVAARLGKVAGLQPLPPEAGMFILIDTSATGQSGETFARGLLDNVLVSVMPGSSFGAQAENLIRLSLTVPDEILQEACERIAAHTAELMAQKGHLDLPVLA